MKYKVYYKNDICNPYNKGSKCIWEMSKSRHIWPEDNTEITLSISGDTLSYSISNLSDRTQYLYDNGLLGLGIFVEENPSWISQKDWWRSVLSKSNHLTRRCLEVIPISSLSGTIDLNNVSGWKYEGYLSRTLYYIFYSSYNYEDPYREDGYETVYLGVGRYYNWAEGFRPHKLSEGLEIEATNKIN